MIERKAPAGPSFDPVELPEGEWFLARPVLRGLCKYESLVDGTLDLADVAMLNTWLEADAENEARAHAAASASRERHP